MEGSGGRLAACRDPAEPHRQPGRGPAGARRCGSMPSSWQGCPLAIRAPRRAGSAGTSAGRSMREPPQHRANPIEHRIDGSEVGGRDAGARPRDAQRRGELACRAGSTAEPVGAIQAGSGRAHGRRGPPGAVLDARGRRAYRGGVRRRLRSPRELGDSCQLVVAFRVPLDPRVTGLSTDAEHPAELGHVDEATLRLLPSPLSLEHELRSFLASVAFRGMPRRSPSPPTSSVKDVRGRRSASDKDLPSLICQRSM